MAKITGKVKKFNKDKGFGFITGDDGKDYFFHYSALNVEGFKTVNVGAAVEFEPQEGERGPRAADINVTDANKAPKEEAK
jgi:cold shock protein